MRRRLKSFGLTTKTCANIQLEFAPTMRITFLATIRTINICKENKVLGLAKYLNMCKLTRWYRGKDWGIILEESSIKTSYSNRN